MFVAVFLWRSSLSSICRSGLVAATGLASCRCCRAGGAKSFIDAKLPQQRLLIAKD